MKQRLLALILALLLMVGGCPLTAFASDPTTALLSAQSLYQLGLFKGTENGFELNRAPTRQEALVMLIRLMGKESQALSGSYSHPFQDVDLWADPYVGYAYKYNLTKGTSATTFDADETVTSAQYITFLLRALGYKDSAGDFYWEQAADKASVIGLTSGKYNPLSTFDRGDVAILSDLALSTRLKNSDMTLLEYLKAASIITEEQIISAGKQSGAGAILTATQISELASPSVFYLKLYQTMADRDADKPIGSASGFFLASDGVAVTNFHAISGASYARITTTDGKQYDVAQVLYYDAARDVAVLRISRTDTSGATVAAFPALTRGDSSTVKNGQTIYTIGSPLGLQNTISNGIVSNANRVLTGQENYPYIQISAPISHGSSGGALLNEKGLVIGITAAGFDDSQNLNLAVPINCLNFADLSAAGSSLYAVHQQYIQSILLNASFPSVLLNVGNSSTVTFSHNCYENDWNMFYDVKDSSLVSAAWGSNDGSNRVPLILAGRRAGTTTVDVTLTALNGAISVKKTITVTVMASDAGASVYANHPTVPNFGKMTGVAPYYSDSNTFLYDTAKIALTYSGSYVSNYVALLQSFNFQYDSSFTNSDGSAVQIYVNDTTNQRVMLGILPQGSGTYFTIVISDL